jgi:hypothetical protein
VPQPPLHLLAPSSTSRTWPREAVVVAVREAREAREAREGVRTEAPC